MKQNNSKLKIFFIILAIILLIALNKQFALIEHGNKLIDNAGQFIAGLGLIGGIVFIILYILATIFLLPGSALTLAAGLIFGVVKGYILVSVASVSGATLSFLIGRYLLRGWVERQIERQPKFKAIDAAVEREGWKIVGLTRLSPLFPFVFLNYAFGVTKVSLKDYVLASWIGMIPGTLMYVYIGYLPKIAAGGTPGNTDIFRLILNIVGFIATVTVTIYVTKIAKKALDSQVKEY